MDVCGVGVSIIWIFGINGFANRLFRFAFLGVVFSIAPVLVPATLATLWVLGSFPTSPFSSGCLPSAERRSSA